jgi:hypothetical protein
VRVAKACVHLALLLCAPCCSRPSFSAEIPDYAKTPRAVRSVTVEDGIQMFHPGEETGGFVAGPIAHFSPDGKRFIVVIKQGNLKRNVNVFSILLYSVDQIEQSPRPGILVKMASSSNRAAIRDPKWLTDNETVAFLGEDPGESPEVYTINVRTKVLQKRTHHPTPVLRYDITQDGRDVVFAAQVERSRAIAAQEQVTGIVVGDKSLVDLIDGGCGSHQWAEGLKLFLQPFKRSATPVASEDEITENSHLSFSPDGKVVVLDGFLRRESIPSSWEQYSDDLIRYLASTKGATGEITSLRRYSWFGTNRRSLSVLVDGPIAPGLIFAPPSWAASGHEVFLKNVYLPWKATEENERIARLSRTYNVALQPPALDIRKTAVDVVATKTEKSDGVEVQLEDNLNTPPRIYAFKRARPDQRFLLLDLNPQFDDIDLGKVETVAWNGSDGQPSQGALYFPHGYIPGQRYPLVIQTHGFHPQMRFSIDGLDDWSSAYAARPLAAAGFVVLQVPMFADNTIQEGPREMARYEGAIDYLDGRGMVDRNRVGISGFSRTVFHVAYTLTHSKFRFQAATLVDGMDGGYFQQIAYIGGDGYFVNGGASFGDGFRSWSERAPSFSLDKVQTPVRLLALRKSGILLQWEWYAGLRLQKKAVDFVLIPDAGDGDNHMLVKPWERKMAQQGLLDWFTFWLKGEQDSNPVKKSQYVRWNKLRMYTR